MLRDALPRILALLAVVVGGTTVISIVLGALSGKSIVHALAVGYYVVGAAVLVGSFVLGSRGPWRTETDDAGSSMLFRGPRRRRKATAEERAEGRRSSVGLFALGVGLVLLGAVVDPSRRAF